MIYKHFEPYKHLINPNYDKHEHIKKAANTQGLGSGSIDNYVKTQGLITKTTLPT